MKEESRAVLKTVYGWHSKFSIGLIVKNFLPLQIYQADYLYVSDK